MLWPLLFIFFIFAELQFRFSILSSLQHISLFLHQKCLSQVPDFSPSREVLAALVCGKNFETPAVAQLYTTTGLIHLFVVSGSHLLLLQKILQKISTRLSFILVLLFIYCAVCLFNPPVTRSFIYLMLATGLHHQHRYWPQHYVLLLAGLMTLMINPLWISSLSLQMSWLATLALSLYREKFYTTSLLTRQILIYFLFQLCFQALGFPQLSVIIVCLILTPLLEFILFPLALLTICLHFLEPFFTLLILILNAGLKLLDYYNTAGFMAIDHFILLNWSLILCGHFFLFWGKPKS